MSLFEKTLSGYGWIRIFLSPVLAGALIGMLLLYLLGDTIFVRVAASILIAAGAAIGLIGPTTSKRKAAHSGFSTGFLKQKTMCNNYTVFSILAA